MEFLEVPVSVIRAPGKSDELIYGRAVNTKTDDYKGRNVAPEDRSRTDGWQVPAFFGSPIAVNGKLYMTTMLGITYVVDYNAKVFDEKALLSVNDLGPSGETWSLNTPSFANGMMVHRSLKEVVCITP